MGPESRRNTDRRSSSDSFVLVVHITRAAWGSGSTSAATLFACMVASCGRNSPLRAEPVSSWSSLGGRLGDAAWGSRDSQLIAAANPHLVTERTLRRNIGE